MLGAVAVAAGVAILVVLWGGDRDGDEQQPARDAGAKTANETRSWSLVSGPVAATPEQLQAAAARVQAFWTPERIIRALQNPEPIPEGPGDVAVAEPDLLTGVATQAAPPERSAASRKAGMATSARCRQPPVTTPEPGYPYERTCGGPLKRYPAATTGALIYYRPGDEAGSVRSCTASVVVSPNESVLLTAGHCVVVDATTSGTGAPAWHEQMIFLPAPQVKRYWDLFHSGGESLEAFEARHAWVALSAFASSGWADRRDFQYDVATVVVLRKGSRTLEDRVGAGQGWRFAGADESAPARARAYGFPGDDPFDGRRLFRCEGPVAGDALWSAGAVFGLGCDMTGGASGGPWFVELDGDGLGVIVSVNSYKYNSKQRGSVMHGPRLSTARHYGEVMEPALNTRVP